MTDIALAVDGEEGLAFALAHHGAGGCDLPQCTTEVVVFLNGGRRCGGDVAHTGVAQIEVNRGAVARAVDRVIQQTDIDVLCFFSRGERERAQHRGVQHIAQARVDEVPFVGFDHDGVGARHIATARDLEEGVACRFVRAAPTGN